MGKCLQNDLFCVEWGLKPQLSQSVVIVVTLQRKQAEFYDSVMTKIRPEPEYFRVGYYGLGFPSFLQASVILAFLSVSVTRFDLKPVFRR